MILEELTKHIDADFSTLLGEFKLTLIGLRAITVQNFIKILSYTANKVVFKIKNDEVIVEGENFKIVEMGVKDVILTGKIYKIYSVKGLNNEKV